jgi:hypothetical protein
VFIAAAIIGSAILTTGATIASVKAQKQATKANVAIAEQQQKQQDETYRRQQRAAVREAQLRRAQGMAMSQGAGVVQSSLTSGGVSSIGSQLGSTLGFGSQMSGISEQITNLGIKSANATQRANTFAAVADIGATSFNYFENLRRSQS